MATISLSSPSSAVQSGLAQFRLQQARRTAEQAEQVARSLQTQAREAQQQASQAQENARSIAAQATQAQGAAGQARQGVAIVESVSKMRTQLNKAIGPVVEKVKVAEPAVPSPAATAPVIKAAALPVVNVEGQTTGTVINTTA